MTRLAMLLLLVALAACGCTHVIGEPSRALADRDLTYTELRDAPESHEGAYILLGGLVAGVRNTPEGGELEVVQTPLAGNGLPLGVHRSEGRFLAVSAAFLDGAVYPPGRPVTLLGRVKGTKTRQLDGADYTYPVVSIKEIHAWEYADGKGYPPLSTDTSGDLYYHGHDTDPPTWFQRPTNGPVLKRWP